MVNSFQFARLPAISFGKGIIARLPSFARQFGKRLIIVTGKGSFTDSPYAERLLSDLQKEGFTWNHVRIPGEPSPDMIDKAVKANGDEKVDLVIGIGGGSALDAGKAVSAMLYKSDSVKEYLEVTGSKIHPGTKVPYIAVPTTSGTGSEATKNAVISQTGNDGFKRSLRH